VLAVKMAFVVVVVDAAVLEYMSQVVVALLKSNEALTILEDVLFANPTNPDVVPDTVKGRPEILVVLPVPIELTCIRPCI
jgi:hypothetical protein